MGFWAWFTGAKTAEKALGTVDNLTNKIAGGLDQLFFTDQERAQISVETMKLHLALVQTTQTESSIRSVTRRIVAWGIMGTFMLLIIFSAFIWKWNPEWAKWTLAIVAQFYELVLMVGFFYFGYYAVSSVVKKAKE
jgi:sterol desaturase/sphingolipid hydroxylase (fatty acid hydroxylase superfamily)